TATFSYRSWDQTTGTEGGKADTSTHGGTTAFSSETGSVSLPVSDVNDRPILDTKASPELTTILEDAAAPQNGVTTGTAQGATLVSSLLTGATDPDGGILGAAITAISKDATLWFSTD